LALLFIANFITIKCEKNFFVHYYSKDAIIFKLAKTNKGITKKKQEKSSKDISIFDTLDELI
jgi:hypothetical protein